MDQSRLDEIRAQIEGWNEGYTDDEILCRANGIIFCVPALLDEIERLLALIEQRDARSLKVAWAGAQHIAELDAKNERLLGALRQAERAAMRVTNGRVVGGSSPEHGRFVMWECGHCAREFKVYVSGHKDRVGKHEADCPFAILKGGDTFAQE